MGKRQEWTRAWCWVRRLQEGRPRRARRRWSVRENDERASRRISDVSVMYRYRIRDTPAPWRIVVTQLATVPTFLLFRELNYLQQRLRCCPRQGASRIMKDPFGLFPSRQFRYVQSAPWKYRLVLFFTMTYYSSQIPKFLLEAQIMYIS